MVRHRLLRVACALVGSVALIAADGFNYDSQSHAMMMAHPEAIPSVIGRYFSSDISNVAPDFAVPPVEYVDTSSQVDQLESVDAKSLSSKLNVLNIFNFGFALSKTDYHVACVVGLHVIRSTEDIPLQSGKRRFVDFALSADSIVLERNSNVKGQATFDASVDNLKHVFQSIGNALFGGKPAPVVTPSAPVPQLGCNDADIISSDVLAKLNGAAVANAASGAPSPSVSPSASPAPSSTATPTSSPTGSSTPSAPGSVAPTLPASPTPQPPLATPPAVASTATPPPAIVLNVSASGDRALVSFDKAANVIIGVGVLDSVQNSLDQADFKFHGASSTNLTAKNSDGRSGNGEFRLSFDDYEGNSANLYCVRARFQEPSQSRVHVFVYCPHRQHIIVATSARARDWHHLDPPYFAPDAFSTEERVGLTSLIKIDDRRELTWQENQEKVDLGDLDFYYVGRPASIVAVKGDASLYAGEYTVTRVTR